MTCPSCGAANTAGVKFCIECGTRLSAGCPACGTVNAPGARFCGECGTRLIGAESRAAGAAGPRIPTAPTESTPTRLADPGSGAVAERRLVSVLFADLVGFTGMAEGRDPEETRELLSRYFDLSREIVDRHGGTIEKFIGDAVMAIWGAPVAREDDAERAVRTGLELVDAVRALAPGIQARAGVVTGQVAVTLGAVGQGMVAGDIVNTAARLQSAAAPGTVLCGESTVRASDRAIAFEAAGPHQLKGKSEPVPGWRALRVVAEVGGRNRSETLEAPFVGREDDLRLLKELFHATGREGRARLVSVVGPAGIGKTRIAWEFAKYADGLVETVWWHTGRSPAYGEGISFWALGEMVRERCGLVETDDEATTRTRVGETLERFVPDPEERRWIEPALLTLLGFGGRPLGSEQLFGAWRTFFERLSASASVALVFEDFHYADSGLIDFVDHLLEWSRTFRIFVMTLSRPELLDRRPDWGAGKRNFVSVYLEPLPDPAMRELLLGLVPGLPEPAVRLIVSRADGIPLYAVETVRMLVASGKLGLVGEAYEPTGDLGELAVPESLTALIAARLDSLAPEDRALLSDAAVLGQSFTPPALAAVSGVEAPVLDGRLRGLVRREILTLSADPRSPERGQFAFVQALIREVAYNTLARRERKVRHLAAARYFESLGTDELAGALAGHYLAAQASAPEGPERDALAVQARLALVAAADRAAALGAHDQAATFLEQAITVASGPAEEAALLERVAREDLAAARYSRAEASLRRAVEIHAASGDDEGFVAASAALVRALNALGRSEDALKALGAASDDAIVAAGAAAASLFAAAAATQLRRVDYRATIEWADRALELAERHELNAIVVDAMTVKAMALNQLDRRLEASVVADGVARFAEAHGFTAEALDARSLFAFAIWEDDPGLAFATLRGDTDAAMRLGDRSRWLRELGGATWIAISLGEWGWAEAAALDALGGDIEPGDRFRLLRTPARLAAFRGEGGGLLDEVRGLAATLDPSAGLWLGLLESEAALLEGRYADARRRVLELVEIVPALEADAYPAAARAGLWNGDADGVRQVMDRWQRAMSHGPWPEADRSAFRAALAALEGRREDALAGYREAIERYRALGMPFELARIQVDMVVALGPTVPEAAAAGDEARAVLERLGATAYLARLEAAMAAPSREGARPSIEEATAPAG